MAKRLKSSEIVAKSLYRIGLELHKDNDDRDYYCMFNDNRINVAIRDFIYGDDDGNEDETMEVYFDITLPGPLCNGISKDVFNAALYIMNQAYGKNIYCSGTKPSDNTGTSFSFCLGLGHECENSDVVWTLSTNPLVFEKPCKTRIGRKVLRSTLQQLSNAYQMLISNMILIPQGFYYDGTHIKKIVRKDNVLS